MSAAYFVSYPLTRMLSATGQWLEQVEALHADCLRQLIKRDDGGVPGTVLKAAQVLLTEA